MNFEYAPFSHLKERSFSSINHAYIFNTSSNRFRSSSNVLAPFSALTSFFHSFFLLFFRLFFQPIWYHFFSYRFLRRTTFLLRLSPFLILTVSSFANAIASSYCADLLRAQCPAIFSTYVFASFISERSIT